MISSHDARVTAVVDAVRSATGGRAHIGTGGVRHVVPLPGDRRFAGGRIDTSELCHILEIDAEARRCVAEPGVTFEALLEETLPLGLAPSVVPELRGITLGGAVAGCSVESMSYRHGGFHDSCRGYEVVTGRGEVLRVGPERSPELFEHLHGSYGTLGLLTELTFDLVPAGRFVEMSYVHLSDFDTFMERLVDACRLDVDRAHELVDAIVFGPEHFVICLGRFVDEATGVPSDYDSLDIYYKSVAGRRQDVLSAEQYFFRYDAECHWLTATVPPLQWRPVRRVFGRHLLGAANLIKWSNRLAPVLGRLKRRPDVVCDVFVPLSRMRDFWSFYGTTFDFWPLWIVPYRPARIYPWIGPALRGPLATEDMLIDCAVYGASNGDRVVDLSEELEREVSALGGIKTLIGRNHYDCDSFWTAYDRDAYEAAKQTLDPDGLFGDLYDKLGRVE